MVHTNRDGKDIKRVLEWLLNRDFTDADLAAALGAPPSNYSRHKDDVTKTMRTIDSEL
ncbi:MAG TPA: hypothetical protein VN255_11335 [Mycobacterium sp.]|nr:hypothetical protein [Mycobacterium sp.]